MKRVDLEAKWKLYGKKTGTLDARVPGCVHTDLVSAGLIPDPFRRDNNRNNRWIEDCDWTYSCTFDAEVRPGAHLVFDCLDTYADVILNGKTVGRADNMFLSYSFDVSSVLRERDNRLEVRFRSPIREVRNYPEAERGAFSKERMQTRRMQCTYGWDWVDRFVTCGIEGPVYLEYPNGIDVESLYIKTDFIDPFGAQISVDYTFRDCGAGAVAHTEVLSPAGEVAATDDFYADRAFAVRRIDILNPQLWYPNGYGEQPLYRLRVTVGDNQKEETFGIRTVRILQEKDSAGSPYEQTAKVMEESEAGRVYGQNQTFSGFAVIVNGVKIFCRGANWVPCEPFVPSVRDEKIDRLLSLAREMGANCLRVWGGGVFEKDFFYSACDRYGFLVIQDFQMACGYYPEKQDWFLRALEAETEQAAKRLRNHPCLAFWQGDNENATKGSDTGSDYIGRIAVLDGIAPMIYRYDYTRQLLPTSPYGGNANGSITCGTSHTTNYLGQIFRYIETGDCRDYIDYFSGFVSRFVSEEGIFGAVSEASMKKFLAEGDLRDPAEEMLRYHTRGNPALGREIFDTVRTFAEKLFGSFRDDGDRLFKYRYLSYEWVRFSMENVRNRLGYCNGLLYWMYDDCLPAALGWSMVDYYGMPKASWYAFRRGAKPVTGSIRVRDGQYVLILSKDREGTETLTYTVYRIQKGNITEKTDGSVAISGYGITEESLPWKEEEGASVVCDIRGKGWTDRCFCRPGVPRLVPCGEAIDVKRGKDRIEFYAKRYVHAVEVTAGDDLEDNYFSMLPGETKILRLPGDEPGETAAWNAYTFEEN